MLQFGQKVSVKSTICGINRGIVSFFSGCASLKDITSLLVTRHTASHL